MSTIDVKLFWLLLSTLSTLNCCTGFYAHCVCVILASQWICTTIDVQYEENDGCTIFIFYFFIESVPILTEVWVPHEEIMLKN